MGMHKKVFMPRANLSWIGTIAVLWQLGLAFVGWASYANLNGVVKYPYLMSALIFVSVVVNGVFLLLSMLYWGPSAGTRPKMSDLDPCRMAPGESFISYERRTSRIIRSYGDDSVLKWVLASSVFLLIWMIQFYWYNNVLQFQPLPPVFTALQFYQYTQAQGFAFAMVGIAAIAIVLGIDNGRDMFKRFVIYHYIPHVEGAQASSMEARLNANASVGNTLLGAIEC